MNKFTLFLISITHRGSLLSLKKKGSAPVLATLLMIAVAVAMGIIIFMWSQGFLGGTSGAAQSQTSAQNVAAESSISIDGVGWGISTEGITIVSINQTTVGDATVTNNTSSGNEYIRIAVRNVGGIGLSIGGVAINDQLQELTFIQGPINSTRLSFMPFGLSSGQFPSELGALVYYFNPNSSQIDESNFRIPPKGFAIINVRFSWEVGTIYDIKVTTTSGTFAQQGMTSPTI